MYVAPKRALANRPSMPATPCSAKTSIASSMRIQYFTVKEFSWAVMNGCDQRTGEGHTLGAVVAHDACDNT